MWIADSYVSVSTPLKLINSDSARIFTDNLFYLCQRDSRLLFTYASSVFSYGWYMDGLPRQGLYSNEI